MALYGDQTTVEKFLRGTPSITLNADFAARFASIRVLVSSTLEEMIGRSFGGGPAVPSARIVYAGAASSLLLPIPARSITGISVLGTWDGTTYLGGVALTAADWVADPIDKYGNILALRLGSALGWGIGDRFGQPLTPIQITGTWTDETGEATVPDDLTEAANYIITERYKQAQASPAGFTGPNGEIIPLRNPFSDPMVQRVIAKYRVYPTIAF